MPDYREKLWPTPWIYIATLLLVPASILVLAPVSLPAGIATGIILYLAAVGSLSLTAPVIEVRDRDAPRRSRDDLARPDRRGGRRLRRRRAASNAAPDSTPGRSS